jgi:hypothetical protein
MYLTRRRDVLIVVRGDADAAILERLAADCVRWIVVSGEVLREIPPDAPRRWQNSSQVAVFSLAVAK